MFVGSKNIQPERDHTNKKGLHNDQMFSSCKRKTRLFDKVPGI